MHCELLGDVCFSVEAVAVVGIILGHVLFAISVLWLDGKNQRTDRIKALTAENERLWAFIIDHDLGEEAHKAFEEEE